jgi:hypothetical protein
VATLTKANHFLNRGQHAHNDKDDFRTPAYLLRFIEDHFGRIDYDGACTPGLNNVATALRLEEPWPIGLVYSNPPYDKDSILAWFAKGEELANAGGTHVMCLPEKVTQTFFVPLIERFEEIIFLGGRVNFVSPYAVKGGASMNGTILTRQGGDKTGLAVSGVLLRDLKARYAA